MTAALLQAILAHAEREAPRECCGVIVSIDGWEHYRPCRNLAAGAAHFEIHPEDYVEAEEAGAITAIVHSHPYAAPTPSQIDRVSCARTGLPWIIVNWPTGAWQRCEPDGYRAPLVGREFAIGVLDCYALIQDYYADTLHIALPDFPRTDGFWKRGEQLYVENFAKAGFVRVPDESLREHDVLLMQVRSEVVNHGAVYLGQGEILHHVMGRLSGREVYGGYWQQVTVMTLRHERLV